VSFGAKLGLCSIGRAFSHEIRAKSKDGARLGLRSYEQERVRAALGSDGEFALRPALGLVRRVSAFALRGLCNASKSSIGRSDPILLNFQV